MARPQGGAGPGAGGAGTRRRSEAPVEPAERAGEHERHEDEARAGRKWRVASAELKRPTLHSSR